MTNEQLLAEWDRVNSQKVDLVNRERELRLAVAKQVFGWNENQLKTGTEAYPLPKGYKAKLTSKVNETIDPSQVHTAYEMLRSLFCSEEQLRQLFRYKVEVSKAAYKTLTPDQKSVIDMITTKKSGTPSLTIQAPKNGGNKN